MKLKHYLSLASIALLFNACSTQYNEAPIATNFKTIKQEKIQSLHHWKIIAQNMADAIKSKIKKPIYIYQNNTNTFDYMFSDFLREKLLQDKIKIKLSPTLTDEYLTYNVKIVKLNKDLSSLRDKQFVPVAIGAGVWLANHSSVTTAAIATTAVLEGFIWHNSKTATGATPNYEISITINIFNNKEYIDTVNRVYYVSNLDYNLYSTKIPKATFKVEGE